MKIYLVTERLIIREMIPEDAQDLFEMDADPEVHRFLGNRPLTHIGQAHDIVTFIRKQYRDLGIGRWTMAHKETGEFIGWTGFKFITEETNRHVDYYDLGYRLKRRHWGYGYATESAKACVAYGFGELQLNDIYAMTENDNTASQHVLEKAGLQHTGDFLHEGIPTRWYELHRQMPADL